MKDYTCKHRKLREIEQEVDRLTFQVYGLGAKCQEQKLFEMIDEGLRLGRDLGEI
jgi:hypothetical protein